MQSGGQCVRPIVGSRWIKFLITVSTLAVAAASPASAQFSGHPPTTTQINGHFLAPAPSVTSITGHHLPVPLPSVTSIPNYGYRYKAGPNPYYSNGRYGRYGYFGGGYAYAIPYYYPIDSSAYGYDYVGGGGPDLYSGPPPGAYDPTLHIVAEQPPANPYLGDIPDPQAYAPPPAKLPDDQPGDPTVLVFRNGHQQEVNSYAIMGDSLYVFDQGRKKIALADLDIPATVKANDDRGVEFRMPPEAKKKAASTMPVTPATPGATPNSAPKSDSVPDNTASAPASVAAAMP